MSTELDDLDRTDRARQVRTRRWLVAALVVACVAGPLAGFAIGRAATDDGTTVGAGTGSGTGDGSVSTLAAGGVGEVAGEPLEHLFTRTTAGGVVIRAYRAPLPA